MQQAPSSAYTLSSQARWNSNMSSEAVDKLFRLMGEMNEQLLTLRQQQASSMNSLSSLTNGLAHLSEEVKKIKGGASSRGGRGGGNRGCGSNRGRRGRGEQHP